MLRAVRPSATGVRPVPRSIVRRYAKQSGDAAPSGGKGADKASAKAPAGAGGAPASAPKAGAGSAAKESKSEAASPAADLKKQAAAQAPAAEGKKPAAEKKEKEASAKGDKSDAASSRRDDKSETAVPGGKQRSEGRGDVKSGAKGGKDAGKGKDKEKDEAAADADESDPAKAKRERRAAKKAQMKEEEDEEEEVEEIPVDETEAEGEFVPPKAEPMTPLEAEEVLRRANANAERGSNLLKAEKYEEAEALIQAAFYQYKGLVPEHHPRMLKVTMELAFVYQVHGRKDAALALYDRGTKHWAAMLGPQSKEYGSLVANWAELLGTIGKHAEAEAKCQEALAVLSPLLPADHEILGGLVANLAAYQAAQSKWDDAYASSTRALKMLEKSLGAGHDYTIFCLENLLKLLNDQGKTDTVEELKLIWQQKTKRPFRVLSQADIDKLMPTDEDMAKLPEQPVAPSTPRSKSFTPPGKMVTPEAFAAEMTAFWKKVQDKGLDTNPAMQNVVLDDLVRARVISPQEREALLQRKREQLSQLIMQKISSFTPEQTKHMVKQYIQVQEAAEEVSNWDGQGITVDVLDVDPANAKSTERKQ